VQTLSEIEELRLPRFMLVTGSFDAPEAPHGAYACVPLYRSLPFWVERLAGERATAIPAWNLYRCVAPTKPGVPG
jgi:hypothetical protein